MNETIEKLFAAIETWPEEDVQALAAYARELEARRTGAYRLSADERVAVEEGLDQARRGIFVAEERVAEMWRRFGVA